ncbi:MAG TPA: hypothetical protein VH741_00605 [Candidatus Limnocylindrales bacterium]
MVWIDEGGATVARTNPDGAPELRSVVREPADQVDPQHLLARVVDEIGDRERVVILGPGWSRTALEREYVTIYQRPDRLVDVELADAEEREHLVERLIALSR